MTRISTIATVLIALASAAHAGPIVQTAPNPQISLPAASPKLLLPAINGLPNAALPAVLPAVTPRPDTMAGPGGGPHVKGDAGGGPHVHENFTGMESQRGGHGPR